MQESENRRQQVTKRTRKLQFDKKTKEKIIQRQYGNCLFCIMSYKLDSSSDLAYEIKDIMHFIPRSQGGLGIEQNGVLGCRYHHMLLDNGNKGLRDEMLQIMEEHLRMSYPNWNREELVYRKW